jgi:hypothetical protein
MRGVYNFSLNPGDSNNNIQGPLPIEFLKKIDQAKWDRLIHNDSQVHACVLQLVRSEPHCIVKQPTIFGLIREAERIHLKLCGSKRCRHLL